MKDLNPINNSFTSEEESYNLNFFQNSKIGQVIVNENLCVISANNRMFQYFHAKFQKEESVTFGRAFNCIQISGNCLECGKSEKCNKCGIQDAVRSILLNNTVVQDKVIQYTFRNGQNHAVKWFQLNGICTCSDKNYANLEFTDVTVLKKQIKQLKHSLTLDSATGTLNKQSLIEEIQQLQDSGLVQGGFTICMIDFDDFKSINDQYGHLMGDRVLKVFSDIARKYIRQEDILGRYGGEEFIFVFKDIDQNRSLLILKQIHRELEDYFIGQKVAVPVTFSAGAIYVELSSGFFPQYAELLDNVDRMLYRAKKQGKSRAMSNVGEVEFKRPHI